MDTHITPAALNCRKYIIESKKENRYIPQDELVVAFFDGYVWSVIPLAFVLSHPLIIIHRHSTQDGGIFSLFVCPMTLRSFLFSQEMYVESVDDLCVVLESVDTQKKFKTSQPCSDGGEMLVGYNEVKILTFRDVCTFTPDFLIYSRTTKKTPFLSKKYYENTENHMGEQIDDLNIHPKTLTYITQYYSHKKADTKTLVLVTTEATKDTVEGYKYREQKYWHGSERNRVSIIEKNAITYPCLWFVVALMDRSSYVIESVS